MKPLGMLPAVCWIALLIAGCGSSATEAGSASSDNSTSATEIRQDLSLGSQGDDVRALNSYLATFGYFPNAELEQRYPAWRPIVPEAPKSVDIYDEHTVEAVMQLQHNAHLPATGVVDAATRAILNAPRCGVPDGIPKLDPSEKFSIEGGGFAPGAGSIFPITYNFPAMPTHPVGFNASFTNPSPSAVQAITNSSFASWAAQSDLHFKASTSATSGVITIQMDTLNAGTLALTDSGRVIHLSKSVSWTQALLQDVITHEIGHAIGLGHSSILNAMMWPLGSNNINLTVDDDVAISCLSDSWQTMPGTATEIAVGADGSVWKTFSVGGVDATAALVGSTWVQDDGTGVHIAVGPDGAPWTVTRDGTTYRRDSADPSARGTYQQMPGTAAAIAIGPDGSVWKLNSTIHDTAGNHMVLRWNEPAFRWDTIGGSGLRIAVGPTGPWVVRADSTIIRWNGAGWDQLPGLAQDIAVGPEAMQNFDFSQTNGYGWILGTNGALYVFDEQLFYNMGTPPPPAEAGWEGATSSAAVHIAVGPNSRVWLVNSAGAILRQTPG